MFITVESKIPSKFGASKKIEISDDDLASDIIRRVCILMDIRMEEKMYLKLDDNREIAGKDRITDYVEAPQIISLCTRRVSQWRWAAAILGFFIGFGMIIAGVALLSAGYGRVFDESQNATFIAVIDAGSSHTATLLFKLRWSENNTSSTADEVEQIAECTFPSGVDSFVGNITQMEPQLAPCFDEVGSDAPQGTRVFLGATAGMRLLQMQDSEEAANIIEELRRLLKESNFNLKNDEDISILEGFMEGTYAWITTNFITDTLKPSQKEAFGSIDAGGASAQIAYECDDEDCSANVEVDLYDTHYNVFSSSLLCYGLEEAMRRFVVASIYFDSLNNNFSTISAQLPNYCMNKAYNTATKDTWLINFPNTKKKIFSSPCADLVDGPFSNAIADLDDEFSFEFIGSFDQSKCEQVLNSLFVDDKCEGIFANGDCIDTNNYPASGNDFFGMSSYYWEFKLILGLSGGETLQEVEEKIKGKCNGTPDANCVECSETDCFETSYLLKMLTDGFKFSSDTFTNIDFVEKVNGESVAWPLGLALEKSNELRKTSMETGSLIVCIVLIVFGLVLLVLSAFALGVFHRRHHNHYLRR